MSQDEVFKLLIQARDGAREVADQSDDWAVQDYFNHLEHNDDDGA